MKVLHVYRTYFPDTQGGLEEAIRQICSNTQALGVDNRVLTLSNHPVPAEVKLPEAEVFRAKNQFEIASCSMSLRAFAPFAKLARWADVVNYHFPWPFADLLHLMRRPGAATVVTYHSDVVRQRRLGLIYQPLQNWFLRSVDRVVYTSPNYARTSAVLRGLTSKSMLIPLGIDENRYPPPEAQVLREVEARFGEDYFLFVGVLRYYKGLHILLEAMRDAAYRVVIAGTGAEEAALRAQARAMGLQNVEFAGYVDDAVKTALFQRCRAVVFPSHLRSEAFGMTLVEGALHGKPLISAEVGTGTSYVNQDGVTGLVVPPGDALALRAAMDQLHGQPELAARMGQFARQRFETEFAGALMGARYHKLYKSLVEEAPIAGLDR